MTTWMDIADQEVAPYHAALKDSGLEEDIAAFWMKLSEARTKKGIKPLGSEEPEKVEST